MVLGGMKAAFELSPSLGPWRVGRLDSADVDSRVWLVLNRTYRLCSSLHGLDTF